MQLFISKRGDRMLKYSIIPLFSTELDSVKRIFVYVPKNYHNTEKSYPVLYMHDGQNLFDDKFAFQHRGWRIIEMYETHKDMPELIIVGIESDGESRADQLIPFPFQFANNDSFFGGKADLYLEFIVNNVKPFIDTQYRTLKDREQTAIMGSSFGGVNSFYAALKYQSYFSRFGSISGAFHYDFFEPLLDVLHKTNFRSIERLYMDTGTNETDDLNRNELYLNCNRQLAEICRQKLDDNHFLYQEIEGAIHHESDWEKRLPDIIKFLFEESTA